MPAKRIHFHLLCPECGRVLDRTFGGKLTAKVGPDDYPGLSGHQSGLVQLCDRNHAWAMFTLPPALERRLYPFDPRTERSDLTRSEAVPADWEGTPVAIEVPFEIV